MGKNGRHAGHVTGTPAEPKERTCGDCDACCVVFNIPELNKAAGVRCSHANGKGCAIYKDRPAPCQQFRCGWHLGYGGSEDRPDKIGVMLHAVPVEPGTTLARLGVDVGIQAHELTRTALSTIGPGVRLVQQLAADQIVTILHHDGSRRVVGPEKLVEQLEAVLRATGVEPRIEGGFVRPGAPTPTPNSEVD